MYCTRWCLTVVLSVVLLFKCPVIQANTESRIVGGELAEYNNTKHQVSIRLKSQESSFGRGHICGGSLIGPNKVLTAAHCVYNSLKKKYRVPKEFIVVMGTLNRYQRPKGTIVSEVSSIATTGTFEYNTLRDDVALMFLKTGLPVNTTHLTVEPIALNNETFPTGYVCQISGWGKVSSTSELPADLRIANVALIDRSLCSLTYVGSIKAGMLCAGYMKGGIDACQGDSGGPLVCNGILTGVVSWGSGCAQVGSPGVYADVKYYIDWITKTNAGGRPTSAGTSSWLAVMFVAIFLILNQF